MLDIPVPSVPIFVSISLSRPQGGDYMHELGEDDEDDDDDEGGKMDDDRPDWWWPSGTFASILEKFHWNLLSNQGP